ncbi:MAG: HAMP domain-containing sensor histidine kinase [Anaeromyxobacter sp.]
MTSTDPSLAADHGPPEAEVEARTLEAQVEALYAKMPLAVGTNVPGAAAVAVLLWERGDRGRIVAWLAALGVVIAVRFALMLLHRRSPDRNRDAARWARRAIVSVLATGLLWAGGVVALLPGAPLEERLAVYTVLTALVAGAAGTLADFMPAFTAYEVPVVISATWVMSSAGSALERFLIPLALLYVVVIWLVANVSGTRFRTALALRFRNEALVDGLARARARLEALNAELEAKVKERTGRLVRAERELAHTSLLASVGSLAAGVAHDVNSPLAGVLANLSWLERELEAPGPADREGVREALAESRQAAERVRDAVKQLSQVARGDGTTEALDLGEILAACATLTAPALRGRARLVREVPALPPVLADRPSLANVFLTLLQRAARAARADGGQGTLRLGARLEAREIVVELADDGVPLEEDDRARLAGSAFGGGDAALSLCHDTVARLGGRIEVSAGERGSVVAVRLPAAAPEAI